MKIKEYLEFCAGEEGINCLFCAKLILRKSRSVRIGLFICDCTNQFKVSFRSFLKSITFKLKDHNSPKEYNFANFISLGQDLTLDVHIYSPLQSYRDHMFIDMELSVEDFPELKKLRKYLDFQYLR